ncbi:predicted GPI-anchored protein 58 isoform X2 [Triticum aestivum]|uniref:predicted GPI-anchored protein 58 isoform X2 n=1 Tax=Triticum aestivum TaxID=4565 RepID=UPI001D0224A6|nr:predicted GPI-anchored protein 58 isoform X2 [Triticum aestivum]
MDGPDHRSALASSTSCAHRSERPSTQPRAAESVWRSHPNSYRSIRGVHALTILLFLASSPASPATMDGRSPRELSCHGRPDPLLPRAPAQDLVGPPSANLPRSSRRSCSSLASPPTPSASNARPPPAPSWPRPAPWPSSSAGLHCQRHARYPSCCRAALFCRRQRAPAASCSPGSTQSGSIWPAWASSTTAPAQRPPPATSPQFWARTMSPFRCDCDDSFDYVGSSLPWTRSSS